MKTFKKTALVASILAATLTFGQAGHATAATTRDKVP